MNNNKTNFEMELEKKLLSSFGWAEVEKTIKERALDAVKTGSMEELIKPVFYMGRPYSAEFPQPVCDMSGEQVEKRLKETGIYQLVEAEISKKS